MGINGEAADGRNIPYYGVGSDVLEIRSTPYMCKTKHRYHVTRLLSSSEAGSFGSSMSPTGIWYYRCSVPTLQVRSWQVSLTAARQG